MGEIEVGVFLTELNQSGFQNKIRSFRKKLHMASQSNPMSAIAYTWHEAQYSHGTLGGVRF
jgi:hypothetical protein